VAAVINDWKKWVWVLRDPFAHTIDSVVLIIIKDLLFVLER